jgi:hypothetical protein
MVENVKNIYNEILYNFGIHHGIYFCCLLSLIRAAN